MEDELFVVFCLGLLAFLVLSIIYPEIQGYPAVGWVGCVLIALPTTLWAIAARRQAKWTKHYLNTEIAKADIQGQIWTLRPGFHEEGFHVYLWQAPNGKYLHDDKTSDVSIAWEHLDIVFPEFGFYKATLPADISVQSGGGPSWVAIEWPEGLSPSQDAALVRAMNGSRNPADIRLGIFFEEGVYINHRSKPYASPSLSDRYKYMDYEAFVSRVRQNVPPQYWLITTKSEDKRQDWFDNEDEAAIQWMRRNGVAWVERLTPGFHIEEVEGPKFHWDWASFLTGVGLIGINLYYRAGYFH